MPEPSFLGIGKAQWDLINSFANWFAAFGSFAAAGVALYIANRGATPSARVMVGTYQVITPGTKGPFPSYVMFRITNSGDRPIRVTQIGWKVGIWRKRYAVQTYDQTQSSPLPVELSHGQEALWLVPFSGADEPWPEYFARKLLLPGWRISLWSLRAQFHTSVGHTFVAKLDHSLVKDLREACEKVKHEG